ncbi:MAG: methyltransferase domain-containing protein, partial [Woeseiaceae bacterium]|nr:methyltransferase domain-containing protein [Woeseiaceae bacterium]
MTHKINTKDVMRRADATATSFSEYDFIHRHCRNDLIEKMKPMNLSPKIGLDLGSALGSSSRYLSKRFKKCEIMSVDLSQSRLIESRKKRSIISRIREVQASANALPFVNNSMDLIFANLLMPWIDNTNHFFSEVSRILKKDGLFIFSTLGPDSFQIFNSIWSKIDNFNHVNHFIDMHIIGDNMLQSGL